MNLYHLDLENTSRMLSAKFPNFSNIYCDSREMTLTFCDAPDLTINLNRLQYLAGNIFHGYVEEQVRNHLDREPIQIVKPRPVNDIQRIADCLDLPDGSTTVDILKQILTNERYILDAALKANRVRNDLISIRNMIKEHIYYRGVNIGLEERKILTSIEEVLLKLTP